MPYKDKKELPEAAKALPEHGQEIWMAAFNAAIEQYQDEEKAFAAAWAAVKNKYEKNEKGEWVAKPKDFSQPVWVEVFRCGRHVDSLGNEREWKEEDLDRIAAQYDPAKHEAPVVIGHPQDNAPAWGWVGEVKREGRTLLAKLKDLVPEFVDLLKKGMFKKRSISLYPDLTLRHVGFLGARPPAVKGLADIKFEEGGFILEFDENQKRKGGTQMSLKDFWKAFFSRAIEDIPEDQIPAGPPRSYSEEEVKEREKKARDQAAAEFAEREKAVREREARLAAQEKEARKKNLQDFCEDLLKKGKLTPAMIRAGMGLVSFLDSLAESPAIEFEESGEKKKQTPLEFAKSFLSGLPKVIEFGETAPRGKDAGNDAQARREKLISDYMEKNKTNYREAILSVSKSAPELFRP